MYRDVGCFQSVCVFFLSDSGTQPISGADLKKSGTPYTIQWITLLLMTLLVILPMCTSDTPKPQARIGYMGNTETRIPTTRAHCWQTPGNFDTVAIKLRDTEYRTDSRIAKPESADPRSKHCHNYVLLAAGLYESKHRLLLETKSYPVKRFCQRDFPANMTVLNFEGKIVDFVIFSSDGWLSVKGYDIKHEVLTTEPIDCHVPNLCSEQCSVYEGLNHYYLCYCDYPYQGFFCEDINPEYYCPYTLTATVGHISSPNWYKGTNYPVYYECTWLIKGGKDATSVRLLFTGFDMEDSHNCAYDYVTFTEGFASTFDIQAKVAAGNLTKYCAKNSPGDVMLYSRDVTVYMYSDDQVTAPGFHIQYQILSEDLTGTPECPVVLTESHGFFTTPFYPNLYPLNWNCTWQIQPSANVTGIRLYVDDFSLEGMDENQRCMDWVQITPGIYSSNEMQNLLDSGYFKYALCSKYEPAPLYYEAQALTVYFYSGRSKQDKGFKIRYETVV